MNIMIDIDKRLYDICCNNSAGKIMPLDVILMKKAIQNGTPLSQEEGEVKEEGEEKNELL